MLHDLHWLDVPEHVQYKLRVAFFVCVRCVRFSFFFVLRKKIDTSPLSALRAPGLF